MFGKKESQRKKDLNLLKNFRQDVLDWKNGHGDRSAINQKMVRVRKLLAITNSSKYLTMDAPQLAGGKRLFTDVNVLDLLFEAPYDADVTPFVIDAVDSAIGVLSDSGFEYPKESSITKTNSEQMRKFNEDEITLFESLISQAESILKRYETQDQNELVNSKEFNKEYDQWRADVFRLFETHFDYPKGIVFQEILQNHIFIFQKRSAKYVEIIHRAMEACYRIPYKKQSTGADKKDDGQPININIHNENKQSQNQSQEVSLLIDLLKDSLAPYQLEELKEAAQADMPVAEKRKTLFDKIVGFGTNVGASVLANILTNPAVYSLL